MQSYIKTITNNSSQDIAYSGYIEIPGTIQIVLIYS